MTSRTSWVAGNGIGLTWSSAFQSADVASLANGSSVLSSQGDIANGTALDMFMDISAVFSIPSSTLVSGSGISFWLYLLQEDGSTYGDGQFPTPGSQVAATPSFPSCGSIPVVGAASQTTIVGSCQQIIIPPGTFRLVLQNNCGFTLSSGTVKYRTYNINLND